MTKTLKIDVSKNTLEKQKNPTFYINETIVNADKVWLISSNDISDWYHTFWELYKHRIVLFIALCANLVENPILKSILKSKKHSNWEICFWTWTQFIIQLETSVWQISYHIPIEYWDKCFFIKEKETANEWDWHNSDDVLERIYKLV